MSAVVADTSPINYLTIIGSVELLPALFETILIPDAVFRELQDERAPAAAREFASRLPAWCVRSIVRLTGHPGLNGLDPGEREAIELALQQKTGLLIDEAEGREAAVRLGLEVTGTLGLLLRGAQAGLIDFDSNIERLLQTNFRVSANTLARVRREVTGQQS